MKKKILIFFLLFSVFPIIANAEIDPHCSNKINQTASKDFDYLKIENIFVKVNNYRKWTKNSSKIATSRFLLLFWVFGVIPVGQPKTQIKKNNTNNHNQNIYYFYYYY